MAKVESFEKNANGFSLVEVLIAAAILSVVSLGVTSLMEIVVKSQGQSNLTFQADVIRRSLVSALNNNQSWKATVMDTANAGAGHARLDCLTTYGPGPTQPGYVCTSDGHTDIPAGSPITAQEIAKIDDAGGNTIYDASAPNYGLTQQGLKCTNFIDPSNGPGNDSCPLRFRILWWAICKTSCVNPTVQLQVVAVYNPSTTNRYAFNPLNYGTPTFVQGSLSSAQCWSQSAGSLVDTCPGNVGIGTITPTSALDVVSGNISARSPTNGTNGTSSTLSADGGLRLVRPSNATSGTTTGYIDFIDSNSGASNRISYNSSSNVMNFTGGAIAVFGSSLNVGSNGNIGGTLSVAGNGFINGNLYVAGVCFHPRTLYRCMKVWPGGTSMDHMTWVDNPGECSGAGYSVEGAMMILAQC